MLLRTAILSIFLLLYCIPVYAEEKSLEYMMANFDLLDDLYYAQNEKYEDISSNISYFDLHVRFMGTQSQDMRQAVIKAELKLHQGALKEAEAIYKDIIKNAPEFQRALMGLAKVYKEKNEYVKAVETYKALLLMQKKMHPYTLLELTEALSSYDFEKSLNYALILSGRSWKFSHMFNQQVGLMLVSKGDFSKAQRFFTKSVLLNGENPLYVYNLAVVFDKQNNSRAAYHYYLDFLKKVDRSSTDYDSYREKARRRIVWLSQESLIKG